MGDDGNSPLVAELYHPTSKRSVVEWIERNLDGRDIGQVERLLQLAAIDICHPDPPHEALVENPRQRANGSGPRSTWVGCMEEVQVDRQTLQCEEAVFTVGENCLGPPIRYPLIVGSRHTPLRHDPRLIGRTTLAKGAAEQSLVMSHFDHAASISVCGVEDRDPRCRSSGDRGERLVLVAVFVGRKTHTAQADPEF